MTAMLQTGQITQLTDITPLFAQPFTQQVAVRPATIGKFFASKDNLYAAWERFIEFNRHQIDTINTRTSKIVMLDGTEYEFRAFETLKDAHQIAGICYYSVDIDLDIMDPRILNYVKTRVRWPH